MILNAILRRPVTLTMIIVLIALMGVISYSRINRQILPSGFSNNFMFVRLSGFNLSPEQTDKQISDPLSGMLRTVKNIERVRATSAEDHVRMHIRFLPSANMKTAYSEVQSVLDRAREFLPEDSEVRIFRWNPDTEAIMWVGFQPESGMSRIDAKQGFENQIKPMLLRIEGVANVDAFGFRSPHAKVKLNPQLLESYQIQPTKVIGAIRQANLTASVGSVGKTPTVFVSAIDNIEQLKNIEVSPGIRLYHLGTVSFESPPKNRLMRINGKEFYWMSISKKDGANVLAVSEKALEALEKIETEQSGRYAFEVMWNQGEEIDKALRTISTTGVFAGVIAFLVVLVFLRNLRMTVLVTTAIPLSVFITLVYLYFSGESLNVLSMMGIMLACGMVVDNAIVVAEAIFAHYEKGLDKSAAIVAGAREVGLPVFMGTATTIAVFLPLILMNGDSNFSFFMSKLGIPVCVALLGSLAVALVIIPHLIQHSAPLKQAKQFGRVWQKVAKTYRRLLTLALNRRFETLMLVGLFAVLTIGMDKRFAPVDDGEDRSRLRFAVEFDESLSHDQKVHYLLEIEKDLDALKDEYEIIQIQTQMWRSSSRGQFRLQRAIGAQVSNGELREQLQERLPVRAGVAYQITDNSENPHSMDERFVDIRLKGLKVEVLDSLALKVKQSVEAIAGVSEVKIESEDIAGRNVDIVPSSGTRRIDITAQSIAQEVRSYLGVAQPFDLEEKYPVEVESSMKVRSLAQVRNIEVQPGVQVGTVAAVKYAAKSVQPRRVDGALSIRLSVFFEEGLDIDTKETVKAQVMNISQNLNLPPGYMLGKDAFQAKQRDDQDMMFAMIMALTLVFLIMGVLFESVILPFVIMFSIPMAFLGSMWMSILTGTASGIMGKLGMVILVGVVVNNGIVLMDLIIRRLRGANDAGMFAEVVAACEQRLRPVIMTAATTILSLVPMAFGASNLLGIPFAPLGHAIIGGLFCSTFITLFLVPVVFTLAREFSAFCRLTIGRKLRLRRVSMPRFRRPGKV